MHWEEHLTSHWDAVSDLTIGKDHKPLISIINDTSLGEIKTPRQQRLKEKLMRWSLTATYVPGKNLEGTDALSRYGVRAHNDDTVYGVFSSALAAAEEDNAILANLLLNISVGKDISGSHRENISALDSSQPPVSISDLVMATDKDKSLAQLREIIQRGFPETKSELPGCIQSYWRCKLILKII